MFVFIINLQYYSEKLCILSNSDYWIGSTVFKINIVQVLTLNQQSLWLNNQADNCKFVLKIFFFK